VGDFASSAHKGFSYFQVVIGYWLGYFVVAFILLPLYYRLGVTSIYHYLKTRFGQTAYRTGALFFLISRTVGATARLYLVINVLHVFILKEMGIPFAVTSFAILLMILLYTLEGGVKTIVYTDTLQTVFMLLGLVVCTIYVMNHLHLGLPSTLRALNQEGYSSMFNGDVKSKGFFLKQIAGGMFITIGMTGLDQEMMQKNISVRNLGDSKKNVLSFSLVMVLVNLLFLLLGGLLYLYLLDRGASYSGNAFLMDGRNVIGDDIFPTVALHYLPQVVSVIFIIGLISALFPSADGALTALTSSFCIDLLGIRDKAGASEQQKKRIRMTVHISFACLFLLSILVFKWIDNKSTINIILDLAGYTYGPLLGLFAFGIFSRRRIPETWGITVVCLVAPAASWILSRYSSTWFGGYQIGIELLLLNGLLTALGLLILSKRGPKAN
jgi:Na+/proline symporter